MWDFFSKDLYSVVLRPINLRNSVVVVGRCRSMIAFTFFGLGFSLSRHSLSIRIHRFRNAIYQHWFNLAFYYRVAHRDTECGNGWSSDGSLLRPNRATLCVHYFVQINFIIYFSPGFWLALILWGDNASKWTFITSIRRRWGRGRRVTIVLILLSRLDRAYYAPIAPWKAGKVLDGFSAITLGRDMGNWQFSEDGRQPLGHIEGRNWEIR